MIFYLGKNFHFSLLRLLCLSKKKLLKCFVDERELKEISFNIFSIYFLCQLPLTVSFCRDKAEMSRISYGAIAIRQTLRFLQHDNAVHCTERFSAIALSQSTWLSLSPFRARSPLLPPVPPWLHFVLDRASLSLFLALGLCCSRWSLSTDCTCVIVIGSMHSWPNLTRCLFFPFYFLI